jgi:hypothetical protein
MLRACLLGSIILLAQYALALGQSLDQTSEGIFPTPDALNRRHYDPNGKPCLAISGHAKPQPLSQNLFHQDDDPKTTLNQYIYEHWISANNSCGQSIKVQVCYHNTDDCIVMNVPSWEHAESILGIYPALADFQYDAKEQF